MALIVNGESEPWDEGMTVKDLLDRLNPDKVPVVVRVGPNTVSRKDFARFAIPDGSEIYFIFMVAGG